MEGTYVGYKSWVFVKSRLNIENVGKTGRKPDYLL